MASNSKTDHIIRSFTTWFFRARPPEVLIIKYLTPLLFAIFGLDWIIGIALTFGDSGLTASFKPGNFIPPSILYSVGTVLLFVIVVCVIMAVSRFRNDRRKESRKQVFVVEARGLRDDDGEALKAAVPKEIKGTQTSYRLDLRQRNDGVIVEPEKLLPNIAIMGVALKQLKTDHNRDDMTVIYGGLTAVPFTFMTGVELDDEGKVVTLDWDRDASSWRELTDEDDGKRFVVDGLDNLAKISEVVLAVSVSYPIVEKDLRSTFDVPIVRLELDERSSSSHWSAAKQSKLATQFQETVKDLSAKGVSHIHLVLAAPNSVVFNFGRRYDRRNLPDISVYQFERDSEFSYPWAVKIPNIGNAPEIVYSNSDGTRVKL